MWSTHLPCTSREGVARTPVLLLPGAFSNAYDVPGTFVQRLRKYAPVILYDHRDSGRSGAWSSSPYTLDDLADDAVKVLETRRVTRVHVIGVSMGGAVAQLMALRAWTRKCACRAVRHAAKDVG